jgi:hypothetical protein
MFGPLQASNTDSPAPVHSAINKGVEPQETGQVGEALLNVDEAIMREACNAAGGQGEYGMIHGPHEQAVKIHEIADDMQGGYLPLTIKQEIITCCKAAQEQHAVIW